MYNAILLATVLAAPPDTQGRDAFEHYLRRLLAWSPLLETGLARPLCSYTTINALFESGAYPFTPHIKNTIDRFNIREFSLQDIVTIADSLLARSSKLEDVTGIKEVLHSLFECSPEPHEASEHPILRADNLHTLALLAAWLGISNEAEAEQICICSTPIKARKLRIKATIEDIEGPLQTIDSFSTHVNPWIATDLASALHCFDEIELWRNAITPEQARLATHVAYYKDSCKCGFIPDWEDLPKIKIRQELLDTAEYLGFKHDPPKVTRLLSAMIDAMARRNLQHTHALRIDRGGNSQQRKRGDDKAFRWDIDYEFHLHYWLTSSNELEFSRVVTHNDFSISD